MQLLSYATHRHRSNRAAVQPSELFHEPGQIEASLRCTVLLRAQLFLFLNSLNSSYSVWRNLVDHQQTIETLEVNGSWVSPHCWWGNDRCWCYENPWCFVGKDTVGRAILPPLLGHPVLLTWRPMKLHPSDQWWSVYWKRGKPYISILRSVIPPDILKMCWSCVSNQCSTQIFFFLIPSWDMQIPCFPGAETKVHYQGMGRVHR